MTKRTPEQDAHNAAALMAELAFYKKENSKTDAEKDMLSDAISWPKLLPVIPARDAIPMLRAQATKYRALSPAICDYMELIADHLEKPTPYHQAN